MQDIELKIYLQNQKRLGKMSEAAKHIYANGLFPKGKEEQMLDIIAQLDSMGEKWF